MKFNKKVMGILTSAVVLGAGMFNAPAFAADTDGAKNPPPQGIHRPMDGHRGRHHQKPQFTKAEIVEHITKASKLTEAKVKELFEQNYRPHDIINAGILANESKKSVESILNMKKINNRWADVAKSLGVDWEKVHKENFKGHKQGSRPGDKDKRPQKPMEKQQ